MRSISGKLIRKTIKTGSSTKPKEFYEPTAPDKLPLKSLEPLSLLTMSAAARKQLILICRVKVFDFKYGSLLNFKSQWSRMDF
jgi:uncharacterized protein YqcC (DUF446 family)